MSDQQTGSVLGSVTFEAVSVPGRPAPWREDKYRDERQSWDCTITYRGESMSCPFWMGVGTAEAPTAADVLGCLCSDYSYTQDDSDLDGVLDGLTYREARKVVEAMERNAADLLRVFGADDLERLAEELNEAGY